MRTSIRSVVVVAIVLAMSLMGCAAGASGAPSLAPTVAVTNAPTEGPTATPDACAAANLTTLTKGKLTLGADNPAYPPYYEATDPKPAGSKWELGDPANGKGLESATAYAVAKALYMIAVVLPLSAAVAVLVAEAARIVKPGGAIVRSRSRKISKFSWWSFEISLEIRARVFPSGMEPSLETSNTVTPASCAICLR